jgi:GNAT superfamily N-acetyltransferase
MWLPRNGRHYPVSPALALLPHGLTLPLLLGPASLRRTIAAERTNAALHDRVILGPHVYLAELAVAPGHQRCGLGSALVRHGLARAVGLPCYVETQTRANVPFYERLGFELRASTRVPGSPVMVWGLLRRPLTRGARSIGV